MFIFLTFVLRYTLRGTKLDIITLLPLSSLSDYDSFIISATIFSGSVSLFISLVPQWMVIFSRVFSMFGLACQCMWLVFAPLKDFTTTFCLPFDSYNPFNSLTIEPPKMTVTLSYFFTCFLIFFKAVGCSTCLFFCFSLFCLTRQPSLVLHNLWY